MGQEDVHQRSSRSSSSSSSRRHSRRRSDSLPLETKNGFSFTGGIGACSASEAVDVDAGSVHASSGREAGSIAHGIEACSANEAVGVDAGSLHASSSSRQAFLPNGQPCLEPGRSAAGEVEGGGGTAAPVCALLPFDPSSYPEELLEDIGSAAPNGGHVNHMQLLSQVNEGWLGIVCVLFAHVIVGGILV